MTTTLDTTRLNQILRSLPGNTEDTIKTIAFQVEALAKMKAPVDTGALRSSIHSRFRGQAETGQEEVLPEPERFHATVGPTVNYALYQELGTENMAAQPYLLPALREVQSQLTQNPRILRTVIDE